MRRSIHFASAVLALLLLLIAPLKAQESSTIRGRITDSTSQQPIAGATVTVGSRSSISQADGRYAITNVPAGTETLRVRMIGYAQATQTVTVTADELVVDVALTGQAVNLAAVVVTGYGQQRVGNVP